MARISGIVQTHKGTPLKAIVVSNGEAIVMTDARGRFTLDADLAVHPFIMATRPDGYGGDGWYAATPPRGGAVRLVLVPPSRRLSARRRLRIGHVTDLHLKTAGWAKGVSMRTQRAIARYATPSPVTSTSLSADLVAVARTCSGLDLVIITGDLTNMGDLPSLRAMRRVLSHTRFPVAPLWAGHDGLYERDVLRLPPPIVRHWQGVFGPTYYAFELARWLVVLHPTEDALFGPQHAAMKRRWLDAQLGLAVAAGRPVILAQHTEIRPPEDQWLRYLASRGVKLLLFGHYHCTRCYEYKGICVVGTPPLVFGSNDDTPRGFRSIELGRRVERVDFHLLVDKTRRRRQRASHMRVIWKRAAPGAVHRGCPLVQAWGEDDRQVWVPLVDEQRRGCAGVLCLDARSGRTRWMTRTSDSIRAAPVVHGRLILAVTYTGQVLALDGATGKIKWSRNLSGFPHRWIGGSVAVVDDTVMAGTAFGGVEAFDLRGRRRWRWRYPGGTGDRWPHYGAPVAAGRHVCMRVHRSAVVAIAASSGRPVWEFGTHYESDMAPLLIAGGKLFVPDRNRFHAVDPRAGVRLWTRTAAPEVARRRRLNGNVCGWSGDDQRLALNIYAQRRYCQMGSAQMRRIGDGRVLWQIDYERDLLDMAHRQRGGANALAAPVFDGRTVWLGGLDGRLRAVDGDNGKQIAVMDLGKPIMAMRLIESQRVVVTAYPDEILCVEGDRG